MQNGRQRLYLSTDGHIWPTRPPGEHPRQVSKNSDLQTRRRCDNKIVTVLSKGEYAKSKMAAVQPYWSTHQNRYRGDAFRGCEESMFKVSTKSFHW